MDSFFQKKEVKDVLLSRAKSSNKVGSSFSGSDENGKFTSEYLSWQFNCVWAKVTVHLNDEERVAWFAEHPEPQNKYEK